MLRLWASLWNEAFFYKSKWIKYRFVSNTLWSAFDDVSDDVWALQAVGKKPAAFLKQVGEKQPALFSSYWF